jgi:hypothetical protein
VDAYALVLNETAAMTFATATRAEQRQLAVILDQLKRAPFRAGDYRQKDETGRMNEVVLLEDWLVTFWSDHAVQEIRVANLEQIKQPSF